MRTFMRSIAAILLLLGLPVFGLPAQRPVSIPELFERLQAKETTDNAMSQFLRLGRSDEEARRYLAQRLPVTIAEQPKRPQVWLNCVRLAGEFRITEAVAPLAKSIYAATEGTPGTLSSRNRLDGFPCAKALVEIGEPAVPKLIEVLEKGTRRQRWFAYRCLYLIGSPDAIGALRDDVNREADAGFRLEIQKALENR